MGDSRDDHQTVVIVNGIDDAMVAHSDAVVIAPCKLGRAGGTRLRGETVDGNANAIA